MPWFLELQSLRTCQNPIVGSCTSPLLQLVKVVFDRYSPPNSLPDNDTPQLESASLVDI